MALSVSASDSPFSRIGSIAAQVRLRPSESQDLGLAVSARGQALCDVSSEVVGRARGVCCGGTVASGAGICVNMLGYQYAV
jgi:hypothetical protein